MEKRRNIIKAVKKYIDTELNSSKKNLYDPKRSDFQEGNIIGEILNSIQNSQTEYEAALSTSRDNHLCMGS